MALDQIQRTLWVKQVLVAYRTTAYAARLANQNLVEMGANAWNVVTAGTMSASNVDDSSDITYGALSDTQVALSVGFDKNVPFIDYDTNGSQTNLDYLRVAMEDASAELIDELDAYLLTQHGDFGSNFDNAGTDWQFTKSTSAEVPAFFGKLDKAVKDLNWPDSKQKYIIGPSGFKEAIVTYSGGRASDFGDSVLTAGLPNAFTYGGWNVFISNNCETVSTTTHGVAGIVGDGFAVKPLIDEVTGMESGRAEGRHATWYRPRLRAVADVYRAAALVDIEFNSTVVATT
jgi:hypothetical protein